MTLRRLFGCGEISRAYKVVRKTFPERRPTIQYLRHITREDLDKVNQNPTDGIAKVNCHGNYSTQSTGKPKDSSSSFQVKNKCNINAICNVRENTYFYKTLVGGVEGRNGPLLFSEL